MQVIIMLPPHISMVLLSATLPNVMDFADWVGRIKRKVVHVTGESLSTHAFSVNTHWRGFGGVAVLGSV